MIILTIIAAAGEARPQKFIVKNKLLKINC